MYTKILHKVKTMKIDACESGEETSLVEGPNSKRKIKIRNI